MSPGLRWLIYPNLVGELLQRTGHDRCGTWKALGKLFSILCGSVFTCPISLLPSIQSVSIIIVKLIIID
jgi:hypothetical protein